MAHTIHVDIVSAEGQIFSGDATMVFAPGSQGELGIAPRHAPLLTTLKAGEVRVQEEGEEEHVFYVGGGALEVQPHLVTVLADTAARARDLDEAAAQAAKQRAEDAIRSRGDKMDIAEAQAELARAVAQLRAIERLRKRR
jgi:F-type H+-transporting ATPase subunit epsilon